ncbi:MAG: hypothetical protein II047_09830, partial [Bacteroidales bacterium]|nr:hypothetical protein [Bacteroidales bacterium]
MGRSLSATVPGLLSPPKKETRKIAAATKKAPAAAARCFHVNSPRSSCTSSMEASKDHPEKTSETNPFSSSKDLGILGNNPISPSYDVTSFLLFFIILYGKFTKKTRKQKKKLSSANTDDNQTSY